jgi:hypothetical protein
MKANKLLVFAIAFALVPLLLFAQIDEYTMQRDITILEDVLNDLLSSDESPKQVSSRGLYLEGYGVIFNVNYGRADHFNFTTGYKVDMKLAQESYAKAQQELAKAFEDKARAREQQEKLGRELENSEQELAQAKEEIARVQEEAAKEAEEIASQKAVTVAAGNVQKVVHEERGLAALYEGQADSITTKRAAEIIAGLKKNLALFYADYAQGLRKLPASERITVLVNFESAPDFMGLPGKDAKSGQKDFYVSLAKSELPALRQSRNPESMLRFQDAKMNAAIERELEIFTGILSKAVGGQADKTPWGGSATRSMYVPGYGAIIMQNSSYSGFANLDALKEYAGQASTGDKVWRLNEGVHSPAEGWKKKIPELKEQIIDQLARYGGSLHSLKPNENIMVVLSSRNGLWGDDRAPAISIAARMSDVTKVFNEEMSLQAFKSTLTVQEY